MEAVTYAGEGTALALFENFPRFLVERKVRIRYSRAQHASEPSHRVLAVSPCSLLEVAIITVFYSQEESRMKSFALTCKASAFAALETRSVLGVQNSGMVQRIRQMLSVMLPAQNVLSLQP